MPASEGELIVGMFGEESTKFFFELTPEKILSAVESVGFRCTGRCLQLNSMENRVYEVEVEIDDDDIPASARERFRIVKFYRPGRWTEAQILEEHRFLQDLVAQEIPVVAPVPDQAGATISSLPDSGILFSLFPKIGGRSPDELEDSQALQVGRLLARMHNVGALREASTRVRMHPTTFMEPSVELLCSGDYIPSFLAKRYEKLTHEILERVKDLFDEFPFQRVHGDAHLGNLLWGNDSAFWVDFDDMVVGPCVQDLWLVLPGRDDYAHGKLRKILEGYEQFRAFDDASLILIEPLRTMRMIHFSAWIAKRWDDPAFQRTFVQFGTEGYWQEQIASLQEQLEFLP